MFTHQVLNWNSSRPNIKVHVFAGAPAATDDRKPKSGVVGAASLSGSSKTSEDRRGSVTDASKGLALGGIAGSIGDAERRKGSETNAARASSAPVVSRWHALVSSLLLLLLLQSMAARMQHSVWVLALPAACRLTFAPSRRPVEDSASTKGGFCFKSQPH